MLNFSTAGPNATGLLSLLFVTGWVVGPFARLADAPRAWHASLIVGLAGVLLSLAGGTLLALAGALVALLATTPHLLALVDRLGVRFGIAAAAGLLAHLALRAALDTAPPYATLAGRVAVVALAVATAVGWWLATRADGAPDRAALAAPGAAGTVAFLLAQIVFLGPAARVALWAGRPYPLVLAASVVGLLAGAAIVAWRSPTRSAVGVAAVLFLGALAALLFLDGPGVAALPAQAAAVVLLGRCCRPGRTTVRRAAATVVGVQAGWLVLAFLSVSAANWAFVFAPVGPLTRGRGALFLLLVGALLPATVLARERRRSERDAAAVGDDTVSPPDSGAGAGPETGHTTDGPPLVSDTRRSLLSATGAGMLALAGAGYHEGQLLAGSSTSTPAVVEALSFNVHQYVDSDGAANLGAVRDTVAALGAGIVGLQETAGGRLTAGGLDGVRWLGHELGYHYASGPPTRAATYGVGLLSRWPVRAVRTVALPGEDTITRVALGAVVESPLGDLPVVVAHLEVEGAVRVAQARRVVELAREVGDPGRAVVLGDMNATPTERPYQLLANEFADPWAGSGTAGYTFSASDPRRRIDYVFAGHEWDARRGVVVGSPDVSDHLGVSATIRARDRSE